MRIVNVIQCTNLGGMEQASLRLMTALRARGHDLHLLSLNRIGALGPLLDAAGISAHGFDYAGNGAAKTLLELRRVLATEPADALIVTGHNLAAFLALGKACRGHRVFAMHFHHEGVMPDWRWRLLYRVARSRFQTITFPSDYVRQEAEAIAPFIKPLTATLRNPLETPEPPSMALRNQFRSEIGVAPDAPLIGNAGWLIPRKRFDVFLDTAALIAKARPDARFVIAGDGELRRALEQQAEDLALTDRLVWVGWQKDMRSFYSAIDVLLFNSDWDAFPTTPVEAMSHGVPVVASLLHGGLGEVLDGTCGWFFENHDTGMLAQATVEALTPVGAERAAKAAIRIGEISNPRSIAETMERYLLGENPCRN